MASTETRTRVCARVALSLAIAAALTACASAAITPLPTHSAPVDVTPSVTSVTPHLVRHVLDSLFDQSMYRTATWGVLVLSPTGDTVYARDPARLLVPASNMKLITTAVALVQLGPDFHFRDTAVALPLRDTVPSDFGPMYDTTFVGMHPLRDILPAILKPSQNRLAEQLFETLALERSGIVSRDSAAAIEQRQLAEWNIPHDGYIIRDGSGFDHGNYLSPETIIRVLQAVRRDTAFTVFYEALPIAGVDGTLARRMRASAAEGHVRAKTGSLGAVRALAGYVTTLSGTELTFSFVCNGFTVAPEVVTATMDSAVVLLAGTVPTP